MKHKNFKYFKVSLFDACIGATVLVIKSAYVKLGCEAKGRSGTVWFSWFLLKKVDMLYEAVFSTVGILQYTTIFHAPLSMLLEYTCLLINLQES